MEILFLDDCPLRAMKFRREVPYAKVVTTAQACIEQLSQQTWHAIFLDHDLNGDSYQDPTEENCGTTVASWICQNKPSIDHIIVHSLNQQERENMVNMLRKENYNVINCSFLKLIERIPSLIKAISKEHHE